MKVTVKGNLNKALDKFASKLQTNTGDSTKLGGVGSSKSKPARNLREKTAQKIRNNIKSGNFAPLSETTLFIRERGLSPNSNFTKTSSKKPLNHTGNLLNSIKATDKGISMAEYGQYHLQPRTIARNGFTNWFYKRYPLK